MSKRIWAVVCGALRQEFELFTTLSCLCEQRKNGYLEGIVLSTWQGEADDIPRFREKLQKIGVVLVESEPVDERVGYKNINFFRQAKQLNAALNRIPDDVFVLKCRTDYSNFDINRMDVLYNDASLELNRHGNFETGFQYKFAVLRLGVSAPFAFHDICFLGYKADMKKLMIFENTELSLGIPLIPDVLFFSGYFVHRFTLIEEYFLLIKYWKCREYMDKLKNPGEDFELPPILNKFYALYFLVLYQSFLIYSDVGQDEAYEVTLADVFGGTKEAGMNKAWILESRVFEVIRKIVSGRLVKTTGYLKLYEEICRMEDLAYVEKLSYTRQDYEETAEWGRKYFHVEPEEWMNPFVKLEQAPACDMGLTDSAVVLFSEYNMDDELYDAIYDIASNRKSYYDTIINNLSLFENKDERLYEKALFASSRYFNPQVLKKLALLLKKGSLSGRDEQAAAYIFKRYAHQEGKLYALPLPKDKIEALYLYSQVEKEKGEEPEVAREFFVRLCSWYRIDGEDVTGTDYVEKILYVMKKIAEKYKNNLQELPSVKKETLSGIIEFLEGKIV